MSNSDNSNNKKPDDEIPEDFGYSLAASAKPEDEDGGGNGSNGGVIITNDDTACPSCHGHFSSPSAYRNHLPCKG